MTPHRDDLHTAASSARDNLGGSAFSRPLVGGPGYAPPWLIIARVSTGSRRELLKHVDTALNAHLHRPEVAAIARDAKLPDVLARGAAGAKAREHLGWSIVFAPGTQRELGVLARLGDVQVLFINSSAAKRDLAENENSYVVIFQALMKDPTFKGADPHAPAAERPQVLAPFMDRFIRDHELAWRIFNSAREAFAVFNIASVAEIDTLASQAEIQWSMHAFEGTAGKKATVVRLTNGELNYYRAGLHGGPQNSLLRGYRWQHEDLSDGRWRRSTDVTDKSLLAHYPEPDPESWWEVETLMRLADDPDVTTWRALADGLGEAGLTSRGADEQGTPLHKLSDPTSAAKLIMQPTKLDAYLTGTMPFTMVGPGDGIWTLPGGHKFHPRDEDDTVGSLTYTMELGRPEWPVGYDAGTVERLKAKWWPNGAPVADPQGTSGTSTARRPLSGLIAWADDANRYEVFTHSGRYELRHQELTGARRRRDGETADMRHEDSTLVASWREEELSQHIGTFIDQAVETFLSEHPDAVPACFAPTTAALFIHEPDPHAEHQRKITDLLELADLASRQRAGARDNANMVSAAGDPAGAQEFFADITRYREREEGLRAEARRLQDNPPASRPSAAAPIAAVHLDVGTPAAVVVALTGAYGAGAQPVELRDALARILGNGNNLRIYPLPGSSTMVRISGEVTLRVADGTDHVLQHDLEVPAKITATRAEQRLNDLAHEYMWTGADLATLASKGRSRTPEVLLRQIRELVGAGSRRPDPNPATRKATAFVAQGARIPDAGLRAAAVTGPLELRQVLWADQTGLTLPPSLPRGYASHVHNLYLAPTGDARNIWQGPWSRPKDIRNRALAVLTSLEATRQLGMRADHLAACLDVSQRAINDISRPLPASGRVDPATLERLAPWCDLAGENLDAHDKRVRPIHCEHETEGRPCRGLVEAVLYVPEVFTTGAGGVCSTCHRAPGHAQRYPASYAARALAERSHLSGQWVRCAHVGCTTDFGVGPGLMWAWDGEPAPTYHDDRCRTGRPSTPAAPRLRPCEYGPCVVDEGHGAGIVANHGRATRRWHSPACREAADLADRAHAAATRPPRHCALGRCTIDEGAGTGMLNASSRPARKWHSFSCRNEALRIEAGGLPQGTVRWSACAYADCVVDEGGGPGQIRIVASATGRPRRHHDDRCGNLARQSATETL